MTSQDARFQQIVDEHYAIFYKIARAYTDSGLDFDDLYQEMLIQLWHALPRFEGQSKLSTYIYRVALNTAMSFNRQQKKQAWQLRLDDAHASTLADNGPQGMEAALNRNQRIDLLYKAINQLKKEDRALVLLHLDGHQYDEMAAILGISTNNAGVRLLRVKQRLQKLLIAEGYERI